jgi:succinyl-diaminopimelate desuccinylase
MYEINRKDTIDLLSNLVAIESTYFEEEEIIDYVCDWLSDNKLQPRIHEYFDSKVTKFHGKNVISELVGDKNGPTICLNGHLDTVNLCEGWVKNPKGEIEGDILYGRGALDMKSGCAAILMAIKAFKENHESFGGKIITTLVSDEEGPYGLGTNALIEDGILNDVDLSIITEPSSGFTGIEFPTLCLGARGGYGLNVEFFGKSAHAATPELGINAITEASKFVKEIDNIEYLKDDFLGEGNACVISIEGDGGACSVPDYAKVTLFWHIVVGEDPDTIVEYIEKAIERAELKGDYKINFREAPSEGSKGFMPYKVDESLNEVKSFKESIAKICGKEAAVTSFSSIGDFDYLGTRLGGAPALVFGAAGKNFHGANEYVEIDSVVKTAEILYDYLVKTLV